MSNPLECRRSAVARRSRVVRLAGDALRWLGESVMLNVHSPFVDRGALPFNGRYTAIEQDEDERVDLTEKDSPQGRQWAGAPGMWQTRGMAWSERGRFRMLVSAVGQATRSCVWPKEFWSGRDWRAVAGSCLIAAACGDSVHTDGSGDGTTVFDEATASDGANVPDEPSVQSCELHDSWLALPPMARPRRGPAAIRLPDGSVLVSGGKISGCTAATELLTTATAELFDPSTNTWKQIDDMPQPRRGHGLLRLENGDVLVVGGLDSSGEPLAATTRYDLASGSWLEGPSFPVPVGPPRVQENGDLRLVLSSDRAFRWMEEGWVEVASDANAPFHHLWPWGNGFIIAGSGARARFYDAQANAWIDGPTVVDGWGRGWETDVTWNVNASAPLNRDELLVLATTYGHHGEIGQQGVAIRLFYGGDEWLPGAAGPFWGDTTQGSARGFAPGWVLAARPSARRGDVYDATIDAWCRTAEAPVRIRGAMIVLADGSVLFTGGGCDGDAPLRWTPW